MSDRQDQPSKRPKLDSDPYFRPGNRLPSYGEGGQVAALEGKLEAKRSEIGELKLHVENLQREKSTLESLLTKLSSTWAKVLAIQILVDLDAAAPQSSFQQEVLLSLPVGREKEEDLLSVLDRQRKVLKGKIKALVEALQRGQPPPPPETPPNVPFPQYHKVISEFATRTLQLEVLYRSSQRAKEDSDRVCEQLRSELNSTITKNKQQQRPRGKEASADDPTRPYREDVAKLKTELENVNRARVAVEEQISKLCAELRVSEERFTASRSFQRLARSVQTLAGRVSLLTVENSELRRIQDELDDRVAAEVLKTRKLEESKRESLEHSLIDLQRKFEKECQEKQSVSSELDALRRLQTHNARLKETESLLSQREAEVDSLKRRLKENKAAREEMEGKVTAGVQLAGELQQSIVDKDGQISDLTSQLQSLNHHSPSDLTQNSLQSRLSQYREEQVKLRDSVRKLESELTSVKNKLNHAQSKLASEKSSARKMAEDLENIEKAYEQAMRQNKALNLQAKNQEIKIAELAVVRQAESQSQILVETQIRLAQERTAAQSTVIAAQQTVIAEMEKSKKDLEKTAAALQSALRDIEFKLKEAEKRLGTDLRSHDLIEDVKQQAADRCRSLEKQLILGATETAQMRFSLSQAESQLSLAQSELSQLRTMDESQREAGIVREVARLRRMVECRECEQRVKNVVIAKCFHSFCRECVERRGGECPRCKQKFASEDLRVVYWE